MNHRRQVVFMSFMLTISLLGDAFLYLALPLFHESFGMSMLWVGIILSINRFVRLFLNSLIVRLINKHGFKKLLVIASLCASVSTLIYGLSTAIWVLLLARIIWAVAYSILRISNLAYATKDPESSGYFLGMYHSVQEFGPMIVLLIGPTFLQWVTLQDFFIYLGLFTLITLPLGKNIPEQPIKKPKKEQPILARPNKPNIIMFFSTFLVDGIYVVTIGLVLLNIGYSQEKALYAASILLVLKRFITLIFSIWIGKLFDKFSVNQLIYYACIGFSVSTFLIMVQLIWVGSILMLIFFAMISVGLPKYVSIHSKAKKRIQNLSDLSTWRDFAAALGALLGGSFFIYIDFQWTYGLFFIIWCMFGYYWRTYTLNVKVVK